MAIKKTEYQTALEHIEAAEKREMDSGKPFYLRALAEEGLGEFSSAYDHFYRATHFEDYLARAYERVARLDFRKNDAVAAVRHAQKAIEKNAINPMLWALKATGLRLIGSVDHAQKAAEKAILLDPIHPWALNELRRLGISDAEKQLIHVLRSDLQCLIESSESVLVAY